MKILFFSDIHGDMAAYELFAALLTDHSSGVLAGDLLDEIIPLADAVQYGLVAADEPEELHGEDWDEVAAFEARYKDAISNPRSINRRGLDIKRRRVAEVLGQAGKPIYFVTGNHDIGRWPDYHLMRNIRGKKVHLDGHSIVGLEERFKGTRSTFRPRIGFSRGIDGRTILVSHVPPFGVLDRTELRGADGRVVRAQHIGNVA
jgi:Icc-related predicted phosphoesterase